MSADSLPTGMLGPGQGAAQSPSLDAILSLCDGILDEPGRRRHLFSWLRAPGTERESWLPVDAYYPRSRLVVVCRREPAADGRVYAEQVPGHGLRLLELTPAELPGDPESLRDLLRRQIADLPGQAVVPRQPQPLTAKQKERHEVLATLATVVQ